MAVVQELGLGEGKPGLIQPKRSEFPRRLLGQWILAAIPWHWRIWCLAFMHCVSWHVPFGAGSKLASGSGRDASAENGLGGDWVSGAPSFYEARQQPC